MPYTLKSAPVRGVLSGHALEIWVSAYNSAAKNVPKGRDAEEYAARVAWSAVKKAGYRKGADGEWHKVGAMASGYSLAEIAEILGELSLDMQGHSEIEIADRAVVGQYEPFEFRLLDRTEALAMPTPTPTKVYAEFKLISFGSGNRNKDGFRSEDITDETVDTLEGSPIYVEDDASDHPAKDARATDRAKYQVGGVTQAEKRDDGIYCIGAFQREFLEDRGIKPETLSESFSVSMEVTFDRAKARYRVGDAILSYRDALAKGAAAPFGEQDDRTKYDVRFIVPTEFHAVALLTRGRNADMEADVLKVAASGEGDDVMDLNENIIWAMDDQEAYLAFLVLDPKAEEALGAKLTTEKRKALPRGAFAYVDEKGEGHLPIHDAAHVRNALARLNQTDIPESKKRSALRKILAAAKRMGVEVDKSADVIKRYAAHMGMEGEIRKIHDAFYSKFARPEPTDYPYIQATYEDYVIANVGDKTFRYDFDKDGDEIDFKEPVQVEVKYTPLKGGAATMAEQDETKKQAEPAPAAQDAAKPKVYAEDSQEFAAAVEARAKEIADKNFAKAKAEIEKAAVEAYKADEAKYTERLKELDDLVPVADEERPELEAKVRAADDLGYAKILAERARALAEEGRKGKARAADDNPKNPAPKTLQGGARKTGDDKDPYRVTTVN